MNFPGSTSSVWHCDLTTFRVAQRSPLSPPPVPEEEDLYPKSSFFESQSIADYAQNRAEWERGEGFMILIRGQSRDSNFVELCGRGVTSVFHRPNALAWGISFLPSRSGNYY